MTEPIRTSPTRRSPNASVFPATGCWNDRVEAAGDFAIEVFAVVAVVANDLAGSTSPSRSQSAAKFDSCSISVSGQVKKSCEGLVTGASISAADMICWLVATPAQVCDVVHMEGFRVEVLQAAGLFPTTQSSFAGAWTPSVTAIRILLKQQ